MVIGESFLVSNNHRKNSANCGTVRVKESSEFCLHHLTKTFHLPSYTFRVGGLLAAEILTKAAVLNFFLWRADWTTSRHVDLEMLGLHETAFMKQLSSRLFLEICSDRQFSRNFHA